MTFVTLGNLRQPFTRLLDGVASITHLLPQPIVVQLGHTAVEDRRWRVVDFFNMVEFEEHVRQARLLIMHAGAGSVIHAIRSAKLPVVMPRRHKYGEHIDDHQLEFARAMASADMVHLAENIADLRNACDIALHDYPELKRRGPSRVLDLVAQVLQNYEKQSAR